MHTLGSELFEGNMNDRTTDGTEDRELTSFAWRGGQERQTTGIWMWSEPFLRTPKGSSEQVAVLLMDTQGMFDNETSMALTAQIFGLSTFVSSFQVWIASVPISDEYTFGQMHLWLLYSKLWSDRYTTLNGEFRKIICSIWPYSLNMDELQSHHRYGSWSATFRFNIFWLRLSIYSFRLVGSPKSPSWCYRASESWWWYSQPWG